MIRTGARAAALLALLPSVCRATSYADPERHDVFSPNRAYVLDVNPKTDRHTVYAVADRSKPLWSFSADVWHAPFFLSNDGKVVAEPAWRHIRVQDVEKATCIRFWNRTGEFKTYSFAEVCPNPRSRGWFEVGPIGGFWRVWYESVTQDGDTLRVMTTESYEHTFSMKDGSILSSRLVWENVLRGYWWVPFLLLVLIVGARVWVVRRRRRKAEAPEPPEAAPQEGIIDLRRGEQFRRSDL
jgi:hypothetical protein